MDDLRLTAQFPDLTAFVDALDLDSMDDQVHGHVPYVCLLIKAQQAFGSELPKTREEKDRFKALLKAKRRSDLEVNFDEALGAAYKAWAPYSVPPGTKDVLAEAASKDIANAGPNQKFWLVAKAVSQFVSSCGKLPLAGTLPDMTADTESFIQLQTLYKTRADGDRAAVHAHATQIAADSGGITVDEETLSLFCRHAQEVELFRFRTLAEEYEEPSCDVFEEEAGDEDSQVGWYVALRAAEEFREAQGRYAGDCEESDLESDVKRLTEEASKLTSSYGVTLEELDKKCKELARYGSAVLHSTSSILGGVASQECVKMLTRQFVPLNNTFIYNGLQGKAQTLEF
jgi:amyloid beta precursor protein binding protein 1